MFKSTQATQAILEPIARPTQTTQGLEQLIISQMNKGIVCVDQNHKIIFFNPFANQFIDVMNPIGRPFHDILKCKNGKDESIELFFDEAFTGKSLMVQKDYSISCGRGTYPITATVFPLKHEETVFAVSLLFEDSSTQTIMLNEERNFLSATAHELRTPLTVIRANITFIRDFFDTLDKGKIVALLTNTDQVVVGQLSMVNDLLNLSRLETGRMEIKKEAFDIHTLTTDVIGEQRPLAKDKKLFLNHTVKDPTMNMVTGDKLKAKEVLTNLVNNAIKYTYQGGVTIIHSAINSHIATKIIDTGKGIEPQFQRLMFQHFQQFGSSRNLSSAKSTGLGLYISKQLAQRMQGDVILEKSEPGQGSTFTFSLPRSYPS